MRLIHRDQRQTQARQPVRRAVAQQPFGRDIQQIEPFLDQVAGDGARLRGLKLRVQGTGVDTELTQRGDLVVHQRDQRRDDHRGTRATQRQGIAAGDDMADDVVLLTAKARKAEGLAQHLRRIAEKGVRIHPGWKTPWWRQIAPAPSQSMTTA